MFRYKILLACLTLAVCNIAVLAQERRVEVSGSVGYTVSSSIEPDVVVDIGGRLVDSVGPKSSFSWGFQGDYNLTERFAVGFLWSRQESKLRTKFLAGDSLDLVDMPVSNYHGVFTYNFGSEDRTMRPFVFGGLGATHYSPDLFDSRTKFSTTWGGGVKVFPTNSFGFKFTGRWTPTYITTDADGIWCNPFTCFVVGDAKYSHQGEFSGGIIFRF